MAAQATRFVSGFARYAWMVFAGLGAMFILLGIWPALFASHGQSRQYFLSFLLINVLWVLLAVFGLRRGERWAWYAIALWPAWLIALSWSGGCGGAVCG
jgi:hypothetical protein